MDWILDNVIYMCIYTLWMNVYVCIHTMEVYIYIMDGCVCIYIYIYNGWMYIYIYDRAKKGNRPQRSLLHICI